MQKSNVRAQGNSPRSPRKRALHHQANTQAHRHQGVIRVGSGTPLQYRPGTRPPEDGAAGLEATAARLFPPPRRDAAAALKS